MIISALAACSDSDAPRSPEATRGSSPGVTSGTTQPSAQNTPVDSGEKARIEAPIKLSPMIVTSTSYAGAPAWKDSMRAEFNLLPGLVPEAETLENLISRIQWGQDSAVRVAAIQLLVEIVGYSTAEQRTKLHIVQALLNAAELYADTRGPLAYVDVYPIFVNEVTNAMISYCGAPVEGGLSHCDKNSNEIKQLEKILQQFKDLGSPGT